MKEDRVMTVIGILTAFTAVLMFTVGRWIVGGIVLLLAFGIFWNRGFGRLNDRSIYENVITTDITTDELFGLLRDMDSPLGRPWLAEHKGFEGRCIVFGPSPFRDCVVISQMKGKLNIKHITRINNIVRGTDDEYRFRDVIQNSENEVTPSRYSIFASFKVASVVMIRELRKLTEALTENRKQHIPEDLGNYRFYYHNSLDGFFRNREDDELLRVESSYKPFQARVMDIEGNEMAAVIPRAYNGKGVVIDSAGYDLLADGEHFGEITRSKRNGGDFFTAKTAVGTFEAEIFPACTRANVSCNYQVRLDGVTKAVIGGSPNIVFEPGGKCQNDIILSYDDDYLVMYAIMEIFIMTLNRKYLT